MNLSGGSPQKFAIWAWAWAKSALLDDSQFGHVVRDIGPGLDGRWFYNVLPISSIRKKRKKNNQNNFLPKEKEKRKQINSGNLLGPL